MVDLEDVLGCVREMAPEGLAEPWDNCGLIIRSGERRIDSVVVCLDVTRAVVDTAINRGVKLIISHHPLIFKPIKRISAGDAAGGMLYDIIKNDINLYAAHTCVDKTYGGLNDLLAGIIGLEMLEPGDAGEQLSYYRIGRLPRALSAGEFERHVLSRLKLDYIYASRGGAAADTVEMGASGDTGETGVAAGASGETGVAAGASGYIENVAVMCGAYDNDVADVIKSKADALLCGEIRYHEAIDLIDGGVHVIQAGHHETERFFIQLIEKWINEKYPAITIHSVGYFDPPMSVHDGAGSPNDI